MIDEVKAQVWTPMTAANHPENRIEAAPVSAPRTSLIRSIVLSILGGLIGMICGVAALSSSLALGEPKSFISVLPLVVMLVMLEAGYVGAMFFMCEEEDSKEPA